MGASVKQSLLRAALLRAPSEGPRSHGGLTRTPQRSGGSKIRSQGCPPPDACNDHCGHDAEPAWLWRPAPMDPAERPPRRTGRSL